VLVLFHLDYGYLYTSAAQEEGKLKGHQAEHVDELKSEKKPQAGMRHSEQPEDLCLDSYAHERDSVRVCFLFWMVTTIVAHKLTMAYEVLLA
jgi:hypothetical protein